MKVVTKLTEALVEDVHALKPCTESEWMALARSPMPGLSRRDIPSRFSLVRQLLVHGEVVAQKTVNSKGGRPLSATYLMDPKFNQSGG